jgi:HD superfamily phosphohydrolase
MKFDVLVYGKQKVEEPLAVSIINNPAMQRLKGIMQAGYYDFTKPVVNSSRFDHSLGVFLLLRKLGAPFEEQISGLIHDISHLTFSHLAEQVYGDFREQGYHEKFREKLLLESGITKLIEEHGLDAEYILDEHNFPLLERKAPDLCADRVDYFMRDSICWGYRTADEINDFLDKVQVAGNEIILADREAALFMGNDFMRNNWEVWGGIWAAGASHTFAKALKRGIELGAITEKDFFGVDAEVISKLVKSGDAETIRLLKSMTKRCFAEGTPEDHDFTNYAKARYVDPKFIQGGDVVRLSEVDEVFKQKLKEFINRYSKPFYIKLVR